MKRIVLPVLFTFLVAATFGQDLKKATSYVNDKKYEKAKTEIDGILAKDPKNPEALYLKSKVYSLMADSSAYKSLFTGDPLAEAFDAFKQAMADSNNPKVTLMVVKDNYSPIFNIYSGYYSEAASAFNDAATSNNKPDTAGFAKAMNLFIKADNVGQYIAEHKWANIGKVDTTLVLNIGKAALNAKNDAMAREYFKKIADAQIKGLHNATNAADPSFELPYQWLVLDYKQAGDSANMVKYATIGKELFPNDDYFDFVVMDYLRDKKDNDALFKKYDELTTKHPDSIDYHLNYATEIFSYLYNSDEGTVINNKDQLESTLKTQLDKALTLAPENASVNLLYAQFYYNRGIVALENASKIKGAKLTPDQQKQKTDLTSQGKDFLKQAIPYGEKAMNTLEQGYKKSERSRYKTAVNLLENIYQSLGDKDKLKLYQDKYDQADTKFVS
jgi:Tfp pilus assembly protein PilF